MTTDAPKYRVPPGLWLGILVLLALFLVAGHLAEGREFLRIARRAEPAWLVVALVAQAATYATEAGVWWVVLRRAGSPQPFGALYPLSIVALFTSQAVPSAGLAGSFLVVRTLEVRGVPHPAAIGTVLVDLVGYYAAYGLSVVGALAVLQAHHALNDAILVTAAAFGLLGFALAGGALWIAAPDRRLPRVLAGIGPLRRAVSSLSAADPEVVRDARTIALAFLLRTGNFALDAFTLWTCLLAIGEPAAPGAALAALVMGSLARTLGIVPGGLGTFEAATVLGLALFGTHVEPALTATLLFRGLSFWLPMLPGFWLGPRVATRGPAREA